MLVIALSVGKKSCQIYAVDMDIGFKISDVSNRFCEKNNISEFRLNRNPKKMLINASTATSRRNLIAVIGIVDIIRKIAFLTKDIGILRTSFSVFVSMTHEY